MPFGMLTIGIILLVVSLFLVLTSILIRVSNFGEATLFSRREKYWCKEAQGWDKNPTIRIPVASSERNVCNCQLKNYVRHWGRFYRLNGLLLFINLF